MVYPLIGQQLKWLNWKWMWPFDGRGAQGLRYGSIMFLGRWLWQVVGWEKPLDLILSDSGRSLRINREVDFHFWSLMNTYQGNFCGFSERRMSKNFMVYHSFPNWNGMPYSIPLGFWTFWTNSNVDFWGNNSYYTMGRGWISQTIPALLRLMTDQDHDGSHIKAPQMSPETSSRHFSGWYLRSS